MDVSSYLVGAAVVIWVIARQFAGRWVPARRSLLLPLVLVVVGIGQAGNVHWTALAVAVVGADAVSLAVQFAVYNARVARDGRPLRRARRRADPRATLAR